MIELLKKRSDIGVAWSNLWNFLNNLLGSPESGQQGRTFSPQETACPANSCPGPSPTEHKQAEDKRDSNIRERYIAEVDNKNWKP